MKPYKTSSLAADSARVLSLSDFTAAADHPVVAKEPIRVLHVYKTWSPDSFGGIESAITALCQQGKAFGIRNRVVFLGPGRSPSRIRHQGLNGVRFPLDYEVASTGLSLSLLFNFRRMAAWADVVHFHFPWPFADMLYFFSRIKKPVIVTYHSDIVRQRLLKFFYTPVMRRFLGSASAVVATSPNYLSTSPVLSRLKKKTRVIPLGIEDKAGTAVNPIRMAYWRDRVGEDFILFVGVMRYYKGLHLLIDAAQSITRTIVIAGAGPIETELKQHAKRLGLKHVLFVGEVDEADKDALYRLCGLFVFPSHLRSEAFGISLLEAAMYGKPLVSSEIGTGTTFINIHEQTGLVVRAGDSGALAGAIHRLLASAEDRQRFGQNARRRFLEFFTFKDMTASYAKLYGEVV